MFAETLTYPVDHPDGAGQPAEKMTDMFPSALVACIAEAFATSL
jgi:hypothetical protein